jgi:type IV pilus assembly protein PilV
MNPMTTNSQRGMTMVEVLVALVVLSIGMLGIAALYVETMRANRTALIRTQAVSLVNDMADRIRANARAQIAYDIDTYGGNPVTRGCVTGGANCTAPALAEDDLARWVTSVRNALPGGIPDLQFTPGFPDRYTIIAQWAEPGAAAPEQYSYQTNLEIIPVVP